MRYPPAAFVLSHEKTVSFLQSAALARALRESAELVWKSHKESEILNFVYWLLRKTPPGSFEVELPKPWGIWSRQDEYAQYFVDSWAQRLNQGPTATTQYLESVEKWKNDSLQQLQELFDAQRTLNQEIQHQLRSTIRSLATVRAAGTIAVTTLSAGAGIAALGGATGFSMGGATILFGAPEIALAGVAAGNEIICSFIRDWHGAPQAKLLAVGKELGQYGGEKLMDAAGEHVVGRAAQLRAQHARLLAKAERRIEHYSRMIAETARTKVARRAGKQLVKAQARQALAKEGIESAGQVARLGRGIRYAAPIVFAAWDIWDALKDLGEDWRAAGSGG